MRTLVLLFQGETMYSNREGCFLVFVFLVEREVGTDKRRIGLNSGNCRCRLVRYGVLAVGLAVERRVMVNWRICWGGRSGADLPRSIGISFRLQEPLTVGSSWELLQQKQYVIIGTVLRKDMSTNDIKSSTDC